MSKSRRLNADTVDWTRLLAFRQTFEQPSFSAGQWVSKEGSLPWYRFSEEVDHFIDAAYRAGVVESFNWPEWQAEAERRFCDVDTLVGSTNHRPKQPKSVR